ncbi:MAG: four helix bundle protein [Bacteroidota bacterium]
MPNLIHDKTYRFALKIIYLVNFLQKEKKEFVLSKQLLRSGTAPGALVREAEHAQSKKDFIHKMSIGLKEINETNYWLNLLKDSSLIEEEKFIPIHQDCLEILRIMAKIVKTSKENLKIATEKA